MQMEDISKEDKLGMIDIFIKHYLEPRNNLNKINQLLTGKKN